MEARAIARYVRRSPRKVRQVVDLIRGKQVDQALNILHFSPKAAAKPIEKTIRSAVANILNNEGASKVEPEQLLIKEAHVDKGFAFRRFRAASMGRAMRMRRPTCHITIVVSDMQSN
jgi:large subunit ribosomal protein L22